MAAVTPLVETKGLACHFGGVKAVDGVDFRLEPGEVRALIGPNGAGKTTLVGMICGRVRPTAGRIAFDGRDITDLPAHKRVLAGIAYSFQITSIFANLSVFDNVALSVQRRLMQQGAMTNAALRQGVMEALARTGLDDRASALAGTLSYGHQRLLEIAMGLALAPRLLILDEPTQGLSDGEIEDFIELVGDVAKDATVLLIEHNMPVVMRVARRITVMHAGAILAEGTPDAIRADKAVQDAYLGVPADG